MSTLTLIQLFCAIAFNLNFSYGNAIVNEGYSSTFVVSNVHLPKNDCDYSTKEAEMARRLSLIKDMSRDAYQQWKTIELVIGGYKGMTMTGMLSSLWVMGLRDEYEQGKGWIEQNYNSSHVLKAQLPTFVVSTDYMASLLSCYALTNDGTFLKSAKQIGDGLMLDFDTPTGLPNYRMTLKRYPAYPDSDFLGNAGGQHLEFTYLADMTNDLEMKAKVDRVRTFLKNVEKPNHGLYMDRINVVTGKWASLSTSLISTTSAFFQYLIKSYIQSGGQDEQAIEMYKEAIDAVLKNGLIQTSSQNNLTYALEFPINNTNNFNMYYIGCYLGAMLALGADSMQRQLDRSGPTTVSNVIQQQTRIERHWTLAKAITETCHHHANSSVTKLPSWSDTNKSFDFVVATAFAESYFVLWRLTQETKYRDYAWELAQAIDKHCRMDYGSNKVNYFANVEDVDVKDQSDKQYINLWYLSSALKYLYLTFSADSLLPLDQWVFNRAGQPLPVCSKNAAYPAQKCVQCDPFVK